MERNANEAECQGHCLYWRAGECRQPEGRLCVNVHHHLIEEQEARLLAMGTTLHCPRCGVWGFSHGEHQGNIDLFDDGSGCVGCSHCGAVWHPDFVPSGYFATSNAVCIECDSQFLVTEHLAYVQYRQDQVAYPNQQTSLGESANTVCVCPKCSDVLAF